MLRITWAEAEARSKALADSWKLCRNPPPISSVYGVPTGGVPIAMWVSQHNGWPLVDEPNRHTLVVDDLIDSGRTARRYAGHHFDVLFRKPHSPTDMVPNAATVAEWIRFPWEADEGEPTDAVVRLLEHLGENPNRDGLADTPRRVVKALTELTAGYRQDPAAILSTTFDVAHDQMIHVQGIEVVSMCEHHMLPFTGTAHVAYVPNDRIVGLSKIPRVVEAFARRLQVQERLTEQIADAIDTHLSPAGVGVRIEAHHSCMGLRGVKQRNARMVTTTLRGIFREDPATQAEFVTEAQQSQTD